jgi:hypothetical protein
MTSYCRQKFDIGRTIWQLDYITINYYCLKIITNDKRHFLRQNSRNTDLQ